MKNHELRRARRESIEKLEIHRDTVIDFIAVWGPLLAPLVPAGLTAAAIVVRFPDLLHINLKAAWGIAIVTVIALEVLGIVSVETWLDMKQYNAANDDKAPEGQARAVVIIYAGVVLGLVFLLKIWQGAALFSLIPLTMLGLITSWTIVLRKQHNQRKWGNEGAADVEQMAAEIERLRNESGQSKKEYDDLRFTFDQTYAELDDLAQKYDDAQAQIDSIQTEYNNSQTKIDHLQTQYDNTLSELNSVKARYEKLLSEFDLNNVLSELTDAQRDNLMKIVELVDQHRITGPSDLLGLSDMSKGTIYNSWQVALASRAIYKNGDNSYHVRN